MGRFIVIAIILLVGCDLYKPVPDTPIDDSDPTGCFSACGKWVEFGCSDPEVCQRFTEPSDSCAEWVSCEDWCKYTVINAPPGVTFNPRCVAAATIPDSIGDKCDWLDERCGSL